MGVTDTSPVVVYSYGPDCGESVAKESGDAYVPQVDYDPTNGTSSSGDLTLTIPKP